MGDEPIIEFLVTEGMSGRILREHIADDTGHCAGCSWQQRTRPVHPCLIRGYAELAADAERER